MRRFLGRLGLDDGDGVRDRMAGRACIGAIARLSRAGGGGVGKVATCVESAALALGFPIRRAIAIEAAVLVDAHRHSRRRLPISKRAFLRRLRRFHVGPRAGRALSGDDIAGAASGALIHLVAGSGRRPGIGICVAVLVVVAVVVVVISQNNRSKANDKHGDIEQ